ncbi:hypothetical protein LCGC14_1493880 [marine sediment metagenome]|uniref:Uncharacterized protein n=1 Tax=marine sediment metagenome TaxID=412755 RepID=A0A0F9J602_9ZZZZ
MTERRVPNLAELDMLETKAAQEGERGDDILARTRLNVATRKQLRPLLNLVGRLGEKLSTFGLALPGENVWHLHTCEAGYINGERETCEDDCGDIAAIVADYQQAKEGK